MFPNRKPPCTAHVAGAVCTYGNAKLNQNDNKYIDIFIHAALAAGGGALFGF